MAHTRHKGGTGMWLEVLGVITPLLAGAGGVVYMTKGRKMPFSEQRSIQNIQNVLQSFLNNQITFQGKSGNYYYEKANFRIEISVYSHLTFVRLKDKRLDAGERTFFKFDYENSTKKLEGVYEESSYYEQYGHYEQNRELLKAFMKKAISTNWKSCEGKKEGVLEKYRLEELSPTPPTLEGFAQSKYPTLAKVIAHYLACYAYIKEHETSLELEEQHAFTRDFGYIEALCQRFDELDEQNQESQLNVMIRAIEEKTRELEEYQHRMRQNTLSEFKKLAEVLQTNNR